MTQTPSSERLKLVLFGKRNAGKSSLINNMAEKSLAIVSEHPGTTTDPVSFPMELAHLGPVVFVDTAGLDDEGDLGALRVGKTMERLRVADVGIFVTPAGEVLTEKEKEMLDTFKQTGKPLLVVFSFFAGEIHASKQALCSTAWAGVDNEAKKGIADVRKRLLDMRDVIRLEPGIVDGVVKAGDFVVLVTPIDSAAPKGRLILPQVETLRGLLDKDCGVMVVKENQLRHFYAQLAMKPHLVITDSQAFQQVTHDLPPDQMLTSFSILMARKKGELSPFIASLRGFEHVAPKSRVLIVESCSHHRQPEDIGTVKIPRLFHERVEPTVEFAWKKRIENVSDLEGYQAVIMCGGCMVTRQEYGNTMALVQQVGIPFLNYGLFLAWVCGLLPRAVMMFPEVYDVWKKTKGKGL